jgi:hypothetical protein
LTAIFQAANSGQITGAQAITALQGIMPSYWQSVAQYQTLPGTADASKHGANCGTYIPGQTTACSPTGGPQCDKSCTALCCVGCRDLMPTVQYAIYLFGLPSGGALNVCTVYSSKYGANQRNSYTLTYTPPVSSATPTTPGIVGGSSGAGATAVSLANPAAIADSTVAGIPLWMLAVGLGAAWFATR